MSDAQRKEVEALYRRYGPALFRRCRTLLGNDAEAQDCLQDTFLGFLKGNWRGEAQPFTVLYRVATFQAIDRLRRRGRWFGKAQLSAVREDEADETVEAQGAAWAQKQQLHQQAPGRYRGVLGRGGRPGERRGGLARVCAAGLFCALRE
jgi:RNA polymerase sigma factor (sigma-70 family)